MLTRSDIISQPAYWVEVLNGKIYDAIVDFMERKNFKQKDMARHLGISPGRMSQILNSGDINFSYDKIVSILLRLDLIPQFELETKSEFLKKELHEYAYISGLTNNKEFTRPNISMKVVAKGHISTVVGKSESKGKLIAVEEAESKYDSKKIKQHRQIA